jgi:hypothetical protein
MIRVKLWRSADNTQLLTAADCSLRITCGCHKKKCLSEWYRYPCVTCNWLPVQKRLPTHVHSRKKQHNSTLSIHRSKNSYYYYYYYYRSVRLIKSWRMRWAGHVARMGERRGVCRVLMGNPWRKRPRGRPRRRWEDNIKMDLQELGCWGMDWIEVAEDRDSWRALVNAAMNLRVP